MVTYIKEIFHPNVVAHGVKYGEKWILKFESQEEYKTIDELYMSSTPPKNTLHFYTDK